jgi:Skp family chaperone for outer membrane proteins
MRSIERILAYTLTGAAVGALVLNSAGLRVLPSAAATPTAPAPDPARVATCDVYQLVERMVEGAPYEPARTAEAERAKTLLAPLEEELGKLQKELEAANSQDPAAQAKFKTFQTKRDDYTSKRQAAEESYRGLVTGQFGDAYAKVCAETKKTANSLGYGYVVAQKKGDIKARNPQQLVEEFLSRPMPVSPDGADITEQVRAALKLPEKAAVPATTPANAIPPTTPTSPEAPKK